MRAPTAALLLCLLLLLAGCSGSKTPPPDPSATPQEGTAVIKGFVTDDELRPLEGVLVTVTAVGGRIFNTTSDADGAFRLEKIPAGNHDVTATKPGYAMGSQRLLMLPSQERELRFTLERLGGGPRHETKEYQGSYQCAADTPTSTGSCDAVIAGPTGGGVLESHTNHSYTLLPEWTGLLFEVSWTTGGGNTLDGVRLVAGSIPDNSTYLRHEQAGNPLRFGFNATEQEGLLLKTIPAQGDRLWLTVEPRVSPAGTCTTACPKGGAAAQLDYTLYVTVFFETPVDPEFTAVAPPA
jgi:hypothetical protein